MNRVIIIAEAGINHNGDIDTAKKMIETAYDCGADIIKFQTFDVDALASKHAEMAGYQRENLGENKSQKEMLRRYYLPYGDFQSIADCCKKIGIQFLSTPFDIKSIRFLDGLQNLWKIPSGEITNYPYLVEIARTGKNIILSTGMCSMDEIGSALEVLEENGAGKIALMHCTTTYPAPFCDVNLRCMLTMKNTFGCMIGYSDHSQGIEVPIAAVALGAKIIEKHFTLDRNMEGPDHKASLEPSELKKMIKSIRNVEQAMGDGEKMPAESERVNIDIVRKSIIAARHISKGDLFTEANLTTKRPGTGINPMRWKEIIGMRAKRDYEEDEFIEI